MGAKAVVDLGDVGGDVLYARVVEAVDPQTRVLAFHLALKIVEGPSGVLQRGGRAVSPFTSFTPKLADVCSFRGVKPAERRALAVAALDCLSKETEARWKSPGM